MLLSVSARERELEFQSIDLLPDLEEDVFFDDVTIVSIEDTFIDGLDDWWGGFISDMYL